MTAVKELVKAGVIRKHKVKVTVAGAGVATKSYSKTLYVGQDQESDFNGAIIGKLWLIGNGTGSAIVSEKNPRRITSRR